MNSPLIFNNNDFGCFTSFSEFSEKPIIEEPFGVFFEEISVTEYEQFVSSEESHLSKMFSRLNLSSKKIQKKDLKPKKCGSGDENSRKKVVWSSSEDKLVWLLYKTVGAQWAKISECLEGKTEAQVKHRFNSYLKVNSEEQEESHRQLLEAMVQRYSVESH